MGKSIYEKIKEAQIAGTFEGAMAAAGKNIRYFSDEWFNSHTLEEISKNLNQEEYEFYHAQVVSVSRREGEERLQAERKRLMDFQNQKQNHIDYYTKICMEKQMKFPKPNRIDEGKIQQDIKHLVGNPFIGDFSYLEKLKEYAGEIEQGNSPEVNIGEK